MDPLDWTHQWEDFEMMMYVETEMEPGIWMQVSRKTQEAGAEQWEVLYDRRIADLPSNNSAPFGSEEWQEATLRAHLNAHPQLVNEEKAHLNSVLQEAGEDAKA